MRIAKTSPKQSSQKFTLLFLRDIWITIKDVYKDKYLFGAVIGGSYFWLIGAYVQLNIIPYGIEMLALSAENSTYLFLISAVGIALGSSLAGKFSGRNIEFGVVPLGAFGMALTCILISFAPGKVFLICLIIVVMGISAGMFIVPLASFIQYRSPENRRGEILATANFLNFTGILFAAVLILGFTHMFHMTAAQGFFVIGLATFVLMITSLIALPDFLLRFIALAVMRIFYRLQLKGIENMPSSGPALLISNHVSWIDALLLLSTSQRRIRFLMERKYYSTRWLTPLMRLMGAIPISLADSPKSILKSLVEARKALDDGYLVCIFAEGQISRTGNMGEFRKGFERILKNSNHPIVPIYIGGAWGSIFSYFHGKPLAKFPSMIPYPVTIIFGKPMPSTSTVPDVRLTVMELSCEMFELAKRHRPRSLGTLFIRTARANWLRAAISDTSGKKMTYGKTLMSSLILAKKISGTVTIQENIGILLPASVGAVLSNLAVSLLGKTPVNLNFTAGNQAVQSAINQCQINTILSSRQFIGKLNNDIKINRKTIFLEDIFSGISMAEKILNFLKAIMLPVRVLDKNPDKCADKLATIIFSSGSTAEPKGVMLTHHNIISNIESLRMVFRIGPKDNICAPLPFFHSFGFTGTLWLPLLSGISASYHPNPMDSGRIAELVRTQSSTILMATPTFLMNYMRKATKDDFKTLRYVVVGAEKLKIRLAEAFQKKFDIQPLEGYGATELSPIAAVNVPNVETHGVHYIGVKIGSVGQPLPGVVTKIVDPDSREVLPVGSPGLLLVKGPNVMKGYLKQPEKTAEVLNNGWYNTGDIATMDQNGFITITDRLSRFSKIGGEMIPHVAVEEAYFKGLNLTDQILAVTSVPDEKKGEKLIVCYLEQAGTP